MVMVDSRNKEPEWWILRCIISAKCPPGKAAGGYRSAEAARGRCSLACWFAGTINHLNASDASRSPGSGAVVVPRS